MHYTNIVAHIFWQSQMYCAIWMQGTTKVTVPDPNAAHSPASAHAVNGELAALVLESYRNCWIQPYDFRHEKVVQRAF